MFSGLATLSFSWAKPPLRKNPNQSLELLGPARPSSESTMNRRAAQEQWDNLQSDLIRWNVWPETEAAFEALRAASEGPGHAKMNSKQIPLVGDLVEAALAARTATTRQNLGRAIEQACKG